MNLNARSLVLMALTVTFLITVLIAIFLSTVGAYAQGNSGNAGGVRGNAHASAQNNNRGSNGNRGAIASELKWRNAAHASAQAFLNASPESAVGKLAEYKDATQAATAAYEAAGIDPASYEVRDIIEIEEDILAVEAAIAALDEVSATYEEDLTALLEELAALEAERELSEVLVREEDAIQLVGADTLSSEALAALWGMINE